MTINNTTPLNVVYYNKIHFEKTKDEDLWFAYFDLEIVYGHISYGVTARRKSYYFDKDLRRFIKNILKEFDSIKYKENMLDKIFYYFNGGQLKFRFKMPEDEAVFILKYTEGMAV